MIIPQSLGAALIFDERIRQIREEACSSQHDDAHVDGELYVAAACYLVGTFYIDWPLDPKWYKPCSSVSGTERIRELTKAGALVAAEIDRLIRKD